jgi:hypothetical protein
MADRKTNGPRDQHPDGDNQDHKIDYAKEAKAARDAFRAQNDMADGLQVQHWTKQRLAEKAGISPETMNRNLSPLQSRTVGKATTLLMDDKKGGGTLYEVAGGSTYGTEHRFADAHLIPAEQAKLKAANPELDPKIEAEAAGGVARWKMTGEPGDVSKQILEKIDIGAGEKLRPDASGQGSGQVDRETRARLEQNPQDSSEVKHEMKPGTQAGEKTTGNEEAPVREKVQGTDGAPAAQLDAPKVDALQKEPSAGPASPASAAPIEPAVLPLIVDIPPGGQVG